MREFFLYLRGNMCGPKAGGRSRVLLRYQYSVDHRTGNYDA